ncbi:MAG: NAD-dependent malic enzyme [Chlamydiae bacterium]|nr:NAD-dependent malic enzyme [Chlamydiota bacterium]
MEIEIDLTPEEILNNPLINKGTAFTLKEREELGLDGYLPYHVSSIELQSLKRYHNFLNQPNHLAKFLFLSSLQNRNEILYYRLLSEHIQEMLPYIYTPTVGDVSLQFSKLYSDHRGVYLSYPQRDKIESIIEKLPPKDIDVIVVTDGERILGLGDVGVGGMAIPVGKLSLYTLLGGIHPKRTLPVFLDVGTNNPDLLHDDQYLGFKHERMVGKPYYDFVERFVDAIHKKYPRVLLQWEDFARPNAKPLLDAYRDRILSFNDDIQGTAAVVLSALLTASKLGKYSLKDQKIVILGGGSAGLGISSQILNFLESEGIPREQGVKQLYILDVGGLLRQDGDILYEEQKNFAKHPDELSDWQVQDPKKINLVEVIRHVKPSILIGVSAQPGAFTEEVVKTMSQGVDLPVILPLSNPTSKAEARPEDILKWTAGKVIIATGSPFAPVEFNGKVISIAQCNNACIFPGLGLGSIASGATKMTDRMFVEAAKVLSLYSPMYTDRTASLFPSFDKIREISKDIALAVGLVAVAEGVAPMKDASALRKEIDRRFWNPVYPTYRKRRTPL